MSATEGFTADVIDGLLAELNDRLRARDIRASVYVVGGSAIAHLPAGRDRVTTDIDVAVSDQAVLDEAAKVATRRGINRRWLNTSATMWMPPLPPDALRRPAEPGLRITYASDEVLLAMKLLALRRGDATDIALLAQRLELAAPTPDDLAALIARVYTDPGSLEMILGPGEDELQRVCELGAAFINRARGRG